MTPKQVKERLAESRSQLKDGLITVPEYHEQLDLIEAEFRRLKDNYIPDREVKYHECKNSK